MDLLSASEAVQSSLSSARNMREKCHFQELYATEFNCHMENNIYQPTAKRKSVAPFQHNDYIHGIQCTPRCVKYRIVKPL